MPFHAGYLFVAKLVEGLLLDDNLENRILSEDFERRQQQLPFLSTGKTEAMVLYFS